MTKSPMAKPQIRVLIVENDLVDRMACRRALTQNLDYEFANNQAGSASQLFSFMHRQCFAGDLNKPAGCEGCLNRTQIVAENFLQLCIGNVAGGDQ